MIIVQSGLLEIETVMDLRTANETRFVIERLGRGSVINALAFLVEDRIDFTIRAATKSVIYMLDPIQFATVSREFEYFDKVITDIIVSNFDVENKIALDYTYGGDIRFVTEY